MRKEKINLSSLTGNNALGYFYGDRNFNALVPQNIKDVSPARKALANHLIDKINNRFKGKE